MSSRRDKRGRATGRLGVRKGDRYALIPVDVIASEAWATLSGSASRVLIALAAQYHGANNGRLTLPYSVAKGLGVRSKGMLIGGLDELEQRGLVELTRQGGLPPLGCSWYALGWKAIDADEARGITPLPAPNRWASWRDGEQQNRRRPPTRNQNASPMVGPRCPDYRTSEGVHWSDDRTTEAPALVRSSDPSKTSGMGTTWGRRRGTNRAERIDLEQARQKVEHLHRTLPHLPAGDLARSTAVPIDIVQKIIEAST